MGYSFRFCLVRWHVIFGVLTFFGLRDFENRF